MKNLINSFLLCMLFGMMTFSVQAQYRKYPKPNKECFDRYGDPISCSRKGPEEAPFRFNIYYSNMQVLLSMQRAINAAQRTAVAKWLSKQESNFTKEINRQLGTKHSSFRLAQKEFFKNYEKNFKKIEQKARSVAQSHSRRAGAINKEQVMYTNEIILIDEWQHLRKICRPIGSIDCGSRFNVTVRGRRLSSAGIATLDGLRKDAFADFSNKEYESAQHISWARGVDKIVNDGSLTAGMVNKHIANYNRKSLQDKVFLMTAYLTQYNNRHKGFLRVPISTYNLPQYWSNTTLLNKGKQKASKLIDSERIFQPNFFKNEAERCNYMSSSSLSRQCQGNWNRLVKLKEKIVREHMEKLLTYSEFGMTVKLNHIREGYIKYKGPGKIGGLDALAYTNYVLDGTGSNANRYYKLKNGGWVYRSNSVRGVNKGVSFSEPSLNDDGYFYYIYNEETKSWHELLLPKKGVGTTSDSYLVDAFWKGMKGVARYALPVEDVIILIDGKDFDGNKANQAEAGVWLVVGFVPGGKILKPVIKGSSKAVKVAFKFGNRTVIQGATLIEAFVTLLNRQNIPLNLSSTFLDGGYRTVKNNIGLNLYRSFGKPVNSNGIFATIDGVFTTSRKGASRNELAITKDFNNSMRFEAKIKVPAGNTLNIGKVAPQKSADGLQTLTGGGDQMLLPSNWDINWVDEVIDNSNGQRYTLNEFRDAFPFLFKR